MFNYRKETKLQFKAYAGNKAPVIKGVFESPITVGNDQELIETFYVIEHGTEQLLGRETGKRLKAWARKYKRNNRKFTGVF